MAKKITKTEAKEFEDRMPNTPPKDQFAVKFLSKRLQQYKNVKIGRADNPTIAKGDVWRKLMSFQQEVEMEIEQLEDELIKNSSLPIYFPEDKEKLVIKTTKLDDLDFKEIIVEPMKGTKDWQAAAQQKKNDKKDKK